MRFGEYRAQGDEDVLNDELIALVREFYAEDYQPFYGKDAARLTA